MSAARVATLPAGVFPMLARAARRIELYLLQRQIAWSRLACQALLRHIENDLLALNLYPEYTKPLQEQIEASQSDLHHELAKQAAPFVQAAPGGPMTLEVTARASSWPGLFDCAFKWEGEQMLGMRMASGLRSTLGTAIHAGTAAFDQAKLDRNPIRADDAADVFIDALRNPEDDVNYKGDDLTLNEAEVIGLLLTVKYCLEIAPRFQFKSVEMPLNPLVVDCGNGVHIRLTGTMDRARTAYYEPIPIEGSNTELLVPREPGGIVIPDIKSGARIIENGQVSLKAKSAQLGVYQMMYEHTTGEPTLGGQIIGLQTTRKAEAAVSRIVDGKRVMIGTESEKGLIEMAAVMFKTGFFPPNPQSQLCSPKFCARWGSCIYHD